jgi:diguanylate cyclase (GGDEF)-like protein
MKILLIEDDDMTSELLTAELSAARYVVEQAKDGALGLELALLWPYDLILLDLQIPKLDGLSVCRQLRDRGHTTPILMLTAQGAQEDIVTGLDTGADDYVTKPFDVGQVLARIRALLRRGSTVGSQAPSLTWGKLCLNPATADVTYGDNVIALTPKEYSLLVLFLRNPQRVFSRSAILDHLWSMDDYPTEGAVTNLVKDLRHRLKRGGVQESVIQTVYGLGYRLKNATSASEAEAASEPVQDPKESDGVSQNLALIAARFQRSIQQRLELLEEVTRVLQAGGNVSHRQRDLARQEAHRLAGGLGTFGCQAGSTLAHQIEQLLQEEQPLDAPTIMQLSQTLLALKQSVAGVPGSPSTQSEGPAADHKQLLVINIPADGCRSLKAAGVSLGWSIDPWASVEKLLHQHPQPTGDVVLLGLDSELPPSKKFVPLEQLKRHWPHVPVVVMSHQDSLADRVRVIRFGADRYVVAPLTPEKLLETCKDLATPPEETEARVLVVDSDPAVCANVAELLTPWGLQVTTIQDSNQFWDGLRQTNPDLLILAQDMPTFSGVDLCQVVRKDSQYGNLPILMMTSYATQLSVQQVFDLGCDDLINKPIISPELITRVLSRIERSRLRQKLDRMRQQQAIYWQHQDLLDPVTHMANALYFDTFLRHQWNRHQHEQAPLALILCAPDRFDQYRETYGRQAAEQRLRQIAQLLQTAINLHIDLVAHYGDAAFSIVLPNTNLAGALQVANRIQQTAEGKSMHSPGGSLNAAISLSLGISGATPTAQQGCDDLLKTAEQALKASQGRGGNTLCLYRI